MTDFGPTPSQFPTPPPPIPPGARTGPPWEQPGEPLQRFVDTMKGVLLDPMVTFTQMRREGGLGAPLAYFLIGLLVATAASLVWHLVGLGMRLPMSMGGGAAEMTGAMAGLGFVLIVLPICQVLGLFIGSGIIHLVLMLFGGAKYGFEATVRTAAYSQGSVFPLFLVPICGNMVAGIWALVCMVIGLAQMHDTTIGKAAAAVIIPIVVCCGLLIAFGAAFIAMIGLAAAHAAH
jgi:hypothetical protein